jgi:hypothetical protein
VSEARPARRGALLALGALVLGHAALLSAYFVPVLSSPDANCYHVSARRLAASGALHERPADPLAFAGGLWVLNAEGELYPKYPPFYPALAAAAELAFGYPAGLWVSPVAAVLAVACSYAAARSLLPPWASVAAAACIALGPVFNSFAVDQIAHATGLAAQSAGFALVLRAGRGRGGAAGAAAAGLCFGFAAGVRYTDVLLALPALYWLASEPGAPRRERLRRAAAFGAGLALPCLALAAYHWRAFGSPLATAYAETGEQTAFSLAYLGRNLRLYSGALLASAFGPLLLLAPVGLALEWRASARRGVFWGLWLAPLSLLYLAYYYAPEHHALSYVRFLLPLGLPVALLALLAVVRFAERARPRRWVQVAIALLLAVQGAWGLRGSLRELELRYGFNALLARRAQAARAALPDDAVVFATRWLLDDLQYRLGPASRARLYENDLLDRERLTGQLDQFRHKASIQPERVERLRELLVDVPPAEHRRALRERIDGALREGRAAFLIGSQAAFGAFEAGFGAEYALRPVAELPAEPPRHRLLAAAGPAPADPGAAFGPCSIARIEPLP